MIFVQVTLHPFLRAMMVYSPKPSLDIHDVYMHLWKCFSIFRFTLFYIVVVHQWFITLPFISYDCGIPTDILVKERSERCCWGIIYELPISAATTIVKDFKRNYDQLLLRTWTASKDFLLFSANIELINMYRSSKWLISRAFHGLLYFPFEFPAGFLSDFVLLRQFQRRHTFLLCTNLESYMEGYQ